MTAPVTFVVPLPDTACESVPPFKFKLLLFVTLPLILEAFVLIVPEFVIVPVDEPRAALLVRVTPEFTVTA